jgi:hypothetical protein
METKPQWDYPMDLSPRRVWLGLTIPGKKMVKVLGLRGVERGRELNYLYGSEPQQALRAVLHTLHQLTERSPESSAVGPAARYLIGTPHLTPEQLFYGAILTDLRDFMKLRFRAKGIQAEPVEILGQLRENSLPKEVRFSHPDLVINYTITALDSLSRHPLEAADFLLALSILRDLLRLTSEALDPIWRD